jgi:hypothetical protein
MAAPIEALAAALRAYSPRHDPDDAEAMSGWSLVRTEGLGNAECRVCGDPVSCAGCDADLRDRSHD